MSTPILPRARTLRPWPVALAAATLVAGAPASGADHVWSTGNFVAGVTAPNPLPVGDTLLGQTVTNNKNFAGITFVNEGTVAWQAADRIGFINATVSNSALWDLQADASLLYAGGGASTFTNQGDFRKSGGAGSSAVGTNISFVNAGVVDAQVGTIDFVGGSASFLAGSQFTGAGVVRIGHNASFTGGFTSQNLELAGGQFSGNAAALAAGSVRWTGGGLAGSWQVDAGQALSGEDGSEKNFSGVTFANLGTLTWTSAQRIGFVNASVSNAGLWDLQADANLSYAGGGASTLVNTGTLRKSGGSGASIVGANVAFTNSGVIQAQAGTIEFAGGNTTFQAGTQFNGAGVVRISHNASFVGSFASQNLWLSSGNFHGDGTSPAQLTGDVRWTGGSFTGTWQVVAGQTLNIDDGSDKNFNGATFTNLGTVNWGSGERAGFVNADIVNAALWDVQTDADLSYAGGGASTFDNQGTLRKSGGSGSTVIGSNLVFTNTGTIDARTGIIDFAGGNVSFHAGTQFIGAGVVRISHNASFIGAFDATDLRLDVGTFNGSNTTPAMMHGGVRWSGGNFFGTWQVPAGETLAVADGIDKNFNGASFTNSGTVNWQSIERAGFVNADIVNDGLWDLQTDADLSYVGGGASSFENRGTLRKSAGNGTTVISSNLVFSNTGTVDAQVGSIEFAGGSVTFLAGTRFAGAGTVRISNNASFVGAFDATDLRLDNGSFNGHNGTPAEMHGGITWTGGSFTGSWQLAAGQTLRVQDGEAKRFNGANFTNQGTLRWDSGESAGLVSSDFTNNGSFDLRTDADIAYAGGGVSTFVNNGTLRKSAGSGSSVVTSNIVFSNPGTVNVLSGTLQFTNTLVNPGTVRGTATVQTPLLHNDGTVAPGASAGADPATLTLAGSFAQGVDGALQIHLESLLSHDLLQVTGSVDLGGTLALACHGDCFFDVGDELVALDYGSTRNGTVFAGLVLSGFASGGFETVYDDAGTRVLLRVTEAVTPVPEPGAAALWMAGLVALTLARRRRIQG